MWTVGWDFGLKYPLVGEKASEWGKVGRNVEVWQYYYVNYFK